MLPWRNVRRVPWYEQCNVVKRSVDVDHDDD